MKENTVVTGGRWGEINGDGGKTNKFFKTLMIEREVKGESLLTIRLNYLNIPTV